MTRPELQHISGLKGMKVLETFLFGKSYAWIQDRDGHWELEKIEEE